MEHAERTKSLALEISRLLLDVRANIVVSRGLLDSAPSPWPGSNSGKFRVVIPEIGFFTWFVSGDLFHGDSLFGALHGFKEEELSGGVGVEDVLSLIKQSDRPNVARGLHEAIVSGDRCLLEYSTFGAGTQRQVALIGCCLKNEEGLASFFCGVVIEKKAGVFLDGSEPFKAYCDAAMSLARERGNLLAARYLKSALNSASGS